MLLGAHRHDVCCPNAVFISDAFSATLESFNPLVHFPFHTSLLPHCANILVSDFFFTPSDHKNQMTEYFSTMVPSSNTAILSIARLGSICNMYVTAI